MSLTFEQMIHILNDYWQKQGCLIIQPIDLEVGAATFHPETFLRAIGPEPWFCAHVQSCRRPTDGRYGENPNRGQHFHQYQVTLKPHPTDLQEKYLNSLRALGIEPLEHDIRFVEDNWESPTLGAWGLGWEVWLDGMEITQYTYFQQVGGLPCGPITGELAYGLERLAMYIQGVNSMYDIVWGHTSSGVVTYGQLYHPFEAEMSSFNFDHAPIDALFLQFKHFTEGVEHLIAQGLSLPAYEYVLKASHTFNLLDARGAISVTERQRYILTIRQLAKGVAEIYLKGREALGFPLLKKDKIHE